MKKALFVATTAGHIRAFHIPFIKMLEEMGCQADVACKVNVDLKEHIKGRVWNIPFSRSLSLFAGIQAARAMRALCEQEKYDFVHVHTPIASFLTRYALRDLNIPVIYTVHGFHFYRGAPLKNQIIYRTAEKIAASWTAAILVMNAEDLEQARGLGYVEGLNLFCVHGVGLDLRCYSGGSRDQARKSLEIPEESFVAACIGELTARKNHIQLLEAWRQVHNEIPQARLLVIGRGELEDYLRRIVWQMDIEESIDFLGSRKDIPEILAAADILVLISKHEGLPRCTMEAMAAGKPVVATDVRGSRDLIADGCNGYLVALDDRHALSDRIVHLARNPDIMKNMGCLGRQKIEGYSIDIVLREVREIYERFIHTPN